MHTNPFKCGGPGCFLTPKEKVAVNAAIKGVPGLAQWVLKEDYGAMKHPELKPFSH